MKAYMYVEQYMDILNIVLLAFLLNSHSIIFQYMSRKCFIVPIIMYNVYANIETAGTKNSHTW